MELLQNGSDVLLHFMLLQALRRHCSVTGSSYADVAEPWLEAFGDMTLRWRVQEPSAAGLAVSTVVQATSMFMLLTRMKLNVEELDYCTLLRASIFHMLRPMRRRMLWQASLAMCFFGSRCFLEALLRQASSERLHTRNLQAAIRRIVYTTVPWQLFCRAYNPNRIRGNTVRRLARCRLPRRRTLQMWSSFLKQHGHAENVILLRPRPHAVCRRHLLSTLGRSMGAFTAKCFFQILRQATPCLPCFKMERKEANMYTETGPGARAALNMLQGLPRSWNIYQRGQRAANVYNQWLLLWLRRWRKCGALLLRRPELQFLRAQISFLSCSGFDEVQFQFVLCELAKTQKYMQTGSKIYERNYDHRRRV
jgi:hypothetical protein